MSTMAPHARVGLVGYGRWGAVWAKTLAKRGVLAWVVDSKHGQRTAAKRDLAELGFSAPVYEELPPFELANMAGVVVAVPTAHHFDVAEYYLAANVPVLLEKPMTGSADRARDLVDLAQNRHTRLMVDHTFLYAPSVSVAFNWARDRVGRIRHVRYTWTNERTNQEDNALWNLGPHPLSISAELARMRGAHISHVAAFGVSTRRPGVDDTVQVALEWDDDSVETFHVANFAAEKVREFEITGEAGAVLCRPNQDEVLYAPHAATGRELWVGAAKKGAEASPLDRVLDRFLSSVPLPHEHGAYAADLVQTMETLEQEMLS